MKKHTKKPTEPKRQKSAVRKIYKTTDGYFNNRDNVKKTRRVAVIDQRKDDGALAVVKIHGKDGKDVTSRHYVPELTLKPEDHPSLTKPSIVSRRVTIGVKDGKSYKAIKERDLTDTEDKLKRKELKKIKQEVHNDTPQHRKTHKNTMKQWKKHFKK